MMPKTIHFSHGPSRCRNCCTPDEEELFCWPFSISFMPLAASCLPPLPPSCCLSLAPSFWLFCWPSLGCVSAFSPFLPASPPLPLSREPSEPLPSLSFPWPFSPLSLSLPASLPCSPVLPPSLALGSLFSPPCPLPSPGESPFGAKRFASRCFAPAGSIRSAIGRSWYGRGISAPASSSPPMSRQPIVSHTPVIVAGICRRFFRR